MSKKEIMLGTLLGFVLMLSCAEESQNKDTEVQVSQSELAKLMRQMEAHGDALRVAVLHDKDLPEMPTGLTGDHIIEASRTPKMTVHEASFPVFAEQFQTSLRLLHSAPIEDRKTAYNALIQSCSNCHQMNCPGPLVKIDKMFIRN